MGGEQALGPRARLGAASPAADPAAAGPRSTHHPPLIALTFCTAGNLWEGDIEDIDGHACVVCPLHRYKVRRCWALRRDRPLLSAVGGWSSASQIGHNVAVC